ncbi:hypothetical protein [Clostridium sp.]|nr:hypothetical protein [Clostridium sp.]MDU2755661.1 hypothetical protein [Clostridium sp.]MDU4728261.1 hypothetical protein [Clostridium sp.]
MKKSNFAKSSLNEIGENNVVKPFINNKVSHFSLAYLNFYI